MTNSNFAAAIAARPAGDTTAELIRAYGNPEGAGSSPSAQGGAWFEPSPAWVEANIVKIPLAELPNFPRCPYGVISGVSLHRLVAPVFVATWAELRRRNLTQHLRTFDGSVAYRHMGHNRSRPLSTHAFGVAVDLDAAWNGYGVPLAKAQINREVARCFEECGWHWGGRWTGNYTDAMHFQWTDPLRGVHVPQWQDNMAHVHGGQPVAGVTVTETTASERRVMLDASGAGQWQDVSGKRATITGASTVIVNATDTGTVWIRAQE